VFRLQHLLRGTNPEELKWILQARSSVLGVQDGDSMGAATYHPAIADDAVRVPSVVVVTTEPM
jgi:hypothetical protein